MALHPQSAADDLRGISLCAGYGGLDLGVHIAEPGYRTVCYVEREAHAAAALVARMGDAAMAPAPVWDDLRSFDGRPWRGRVHLVSAGYPCQPFSQAGVRRGAVDPRHLWPEVARIIDEARPKWAFLENVEGHVSLGLGDVARELQALGYDVKAGLFSAAEAGASHLRRRLFILAHAHGDRRGLLSGHADRGWAAGLQGAVRRLPRKRRPVLIREHGAGLDALVVDDPDLRLRSGQPAAGVFTPGPDQFADWQRLLDERPDLEPALLREADGMADRLDRTRGVGNGVCSVAAAFAWATLRDAHLRVA